VEQTSRPDTTDAYELVARYHDGPDADAAAEALVVRGIGAVVEQRQDHEAEHVVLVVAGGAERAREILGIAPPDDADRPIAKVGRPSVFWIGVVFLVAMIVLPLITFLVTVKLAGG